MRSFLQVCTLSARELKSAAVAQLGAFIAQQEDLELPPTGLEVTQVCVRVVAKLSASCACGRQLCS